MCSYFTHFADDAAQQQAARARQIRYYRECVIPAFPGDPATAPPSYRYFIAMVERLRNVRPEDLTENSVLLGSPAHIIDVLKQGGSGRLRRGDPVLQRRPETAWPGEGRNGALHGTGGTVISMSMQDRLELYSRNKLKLGLFGANCSSGRAVTKVPERWSGSWADCLRLARMADEAGIEFMLPVGRWKGYGGDTDYQGETLETVTWAAGLLGATKRLTVFGTVHAPLIHPLIAAKQFVTADHIGEGRFGLNIVCGWNEGEFDMFGATMREHAARYDYAQEWFDAIKLAWSDAEDFDVRWPVHPAAPGSRQAKAIRRQPADRDERRRITDRPGIRDPQLRCAVLDDAEGQAG